MAVSAMRPMAGSVSYTSSALRYAFSLDSLATIFVTPAVKAAVWASVQPTKQLTSASLTPGAGMVGSR